MNRRNFLKTSSMGFLGSLVPGIINAQKNNVSEVVDIHMHLIGESQSNGCYLGPRARKSLSYKMLVPFLDINRNAGSDEIDRQYVKMLRQKVESTSIPYIGILIAMDGVYNKKGELDFDRTPYYVPNEYLFKVCAESTSFFPGASVNPNRKDALDELEKVIENGAVLIKWLPNSQNINPTDSRHIDFYRILAEKDIPLLVHGGKEHTVPVEDQSLGNPEHLMLPLEEGVTVIVAHCADTGGDKHGKYFDRFLNMLKTSPNLYGDISSLTFLHKTLKLRYFLNHPELFDRLFYGSDFPLISTPLVSSFYFLGKLSLRDMFQIEGIDNDLERNLTLNRKLGVPEHCFRRGKELLKLG